MYTDPPLRQTLRNPSLNVQLLRHPQENSQQPQSLSETTNTIAWDRSESLLCIWLPVRSGTSFLAHRSYFDTMRHGSAVPHREYTPFLPPLGICILHPKQTLYDPTHPPHCHESVLYELISPRTLNQTVGSACRVHTLRGTKSERLKHRLCLGEHSARARTRGTQPQDLTQISNCNRCRNSVNAPPIVGFPECASKDLTTKS